MRKPVFAKISATIVASACVLGAGISTSVASAQPVPQPAPQSSVQSVTNSIVKPTVRSTFRPATRAEIRRAAFRPATPAKLRKAAQLQLRPVNMYYSCNDWYMVGQSRMNGFTDGVIRFWANRNGTINMWFTGDRIETSSAIYARYGFLDRPSTHFGAELIAPGRGYRLFVWSMAGGDNYGGDYKVGEWTRFCLGQKWLP